MAINPIVAAHLKEARRELVAQREALDRDLAQLDSMLEGYADDRSGVGTTMAAVAEYNARVLRHNLAQTPAPSMRDAIMALLSSEDRPFATKEIVAVLGKRYGWASSSTRSQVARMAKGGEIAQVRRGFYATNPPEGSVFSVFDSENSSGPAESAGPEVGVTTSGAGGDAEDAPSHDPDHAATGWNRDRGGHPAVTDEVTV